MSAKPPSHSACRASLIVPTFNRASGVRALLGELDRQTLAPESFEVIVVDDGSEVDVRHALPSCSHRFSLRIERRGGNAGPGAARQLGACHAAGEVLVFLDDDMEVPPGFLEAHLAHHARHDRLVVLGCQRAHDATDDAPLLERYRIGIGERLSADIAAGRKKLAGEHLYTGNVSLPRALFTEVGGFDVRLRQIEDIDLGIRLEKAGAGFLLSQEAWSRHRREELTVEAWFERSLADGRSWSAVAAKHQDEPTASPWHLLDLVNPVSRPLLTLSALAPAPAALLGKSAFKTASAADALGFERIAMAGATFVYSVQMFRGVGSAAGGGRGALREYREFRRALRELHGKRGRRASAMGNLAAAIEADYHALVENSARYDPRGRTVGSPRSAFVTNTGFQVVVAYRVMRHMRAAGFPLAARVIARAIRHLYGSDIHWDADLGPGLVVVHGFGLAISYATRAGARCTLAHNVTLGVGRDAATGAVGAPTLEAGVSVGPGATLIGPIVVGRESKIMPGCTVYESVPERSVVESPPVSMRPRSAAKPTDGDP